MLTPGNRIRLDAMPDDPDPVPVGSTGTVEDCYHVDLGPGQKFWHVIVKWDSGRSLMLSIPPDRVTRIS